MYRSTSFCQWGGRFAGPEWASDAGISRASPPGSGVLAETWTPEPVPESTASVSSLSALLCAGTVFSNYPSSSPPAAARPFRREASEPSPGRELSEANSAREASRGMAVVGESEGIASSGLAEPDSPALESVSLKGERSVRGSVGEFSAVGVSPTCMGISLVVPLWPERLAREVSAGSTGSRPWECDVRKKNQQRIRIIAIRAGPREGAMSVGARIRRSSFKEGGSTESVWSRSAVCQSSARRGCWPRKHRVSTRLSLFWQRSQIRAH